MYSLKMIQEAANYKLKEPNPLDAAVNNALGTPPVIRRRNEKLGTGAAEEPKKKTSPIDGAVGDPALVRQRRNVELGLGKIVDGERNKKTRRGKGRGRSKSNNIEDHDAHVKAKEERDDLRARVKKITGRLGAAEEPNKKTSRGRSKSNNIEGDHNAHVKAKEERDDTRIRAKRINDRLAADARNAKFWTKHDAAKADFGESDIVRQGKNKLIARKREVENERVEKARERIKTNREAAWAKHKAEGVMNTRAAQMNAGARNTLTRKIEKRSADNKVLKLDANIAARKKHLENKAKTSKQRKNRGAIAAAGLAATGGLIHQNRDAIKSAYDDI